MKKEEMTLPEATVKTLSKKSTITLVAGKARALSAQDPDFVRAAIPVATTTHLGAQSIAFDAVGRNAILADPDFGGGQYDQAKGPEGALQSPG